MGEQIRVLERSSIGVQVLRWAVSALLVGIGFYFLNLSLSHLWAGTGPPNPNPEWHVQWGYRFFWSSVASFVGAMSVVWFLRKRRPVRDHQASAGQSGATEDR